MGLSFCCDAKLLRCIKLYLKMYKNYIISCLQNQPVSARKRYRIVNQSAQFSDNSLAGRHSTSVIASWPAKFSISSGWTAGRVTLG